MTSPRTLSTLRAELDAIDDRILALIEQRLAASAAIAEAKGNAGDGLLKLRPRRQAEVVARLQSRAGRAPAVAIAAIWRELMAHTLQGQARTDIVLCADERSELLEARVRLHFGAAFPIVWAEHRSEALRRAQEEEAIAVLVEPLAAGEAAPLTIFDVVRGGDGETVAYAIGRVAPGDALTGPDGGDTEWTPGGWRAHPAQQMPAYPDARALAAVEEQLGAAPPLVPYAQTMALKSALAEVAHGRAFLLQGGDCAESFAEFSAEKVRRDERLLLGMGNVIADGGLGVVHVARAAGQFAKPRSEAMESRNGITLPSYRGDAVNGRAFSSAARTPNPERLLEIHRQSQATLALLSAFRLSERGQAPVYVSHEALLLQYEQALTRLDPETGRHWAGSGHMVWIGERTRALGGAHVAFASGIANPIGLKCGPGVDPDTLLRLIDRLDPSNEPGRLVLVGRFGAGRIGAALPALMRTTRRAGANAIWSIDPMHGNGVTVGGIKTRQVHDILAECETFFEIAAAEGVHAGGIHLEMSGSDVTECLGGHCGIGEADLGARYLSHCDPRLNPAQALEVATTVAALVGRTAERRCDAA